MPGTCLPRVRSRPSDEACEDAVPGPGATRRLVGIDMMSEQVPDATTLPESRRLPGGLGEGMLAELVPVPGERGVITRGGPSPTPPSPGPPPPARNRERSRDPEAHQARRGNNLFWFNKNCAEIALIFEQRTHRFLRSIRIA